MVIKFRNLKNLLFLPLLLYYCIITNCFISENFFGDEERYLNYAQNLSNFHYSPKDDIEFINGPGYPILLLPFVLIKSPICYAKFLNSLLLYFSLLYCFNLFNLYSKKNNAVILHTYILGLYPPFLKWLFYLLPEAFTWFLLCGFIYHFCLFNKILSFSLKNFLLCSFYLGFLALTKIIFGYVILTGIILFVFLYLFFNVKYILKNLSIFFFSLCLCLPYLYYTYSLTGKIFYWGTGGGEQLYWMSTPYIDEYGDWFSDKTVNESNNDWNRNLTQLKKKHAIYLNIYENFNSVDRDKIFKLIAIENIKSNPMAFLKKWMASIGRYFFNTPFSYTYQKLSTYFYMLPNMFLIVICFFCSYPTFINWNFFPYEIKTLIIFCIIYSGGSSLLGADVRQFIPIVPILFLWIFFSIDNFIKVQIHIPYPKLNDF